MPDIIHTQDKARNHETVYTGFDGKPYIRESSHADRLASPLEIATHRAPRRQIERWRDHG